VCVLRGHGITVTGATVEQAVVRAINLTALATVTADLARMGATARDIDSGDIADLPDLGSVFNDQAAWRYYRAELGRDGRRQ
jgi:ribulose-5-phosphate 4-epimerase/fuculose-1-phosphate aldolase